MRLPWTIVLAGVIACGADSASQPRVVSLPKSSKAAPCLDLIKNRLDTAQTLLSQGRVERAARSLRSAPVACHSAQLTGELNAIEEHLRSDAAAAELLARAEQARQAGEVVTARRLRAQALHALDKASTLVSAVRHRPYVGGEGWFSPSGEVLVRATGPELSLTRVEDGELLALLAGPERAVTTIAFSPGETALAAAAADGSVWLWDVATGGDLKHWRLEEHAEGLMFARRGAELRVYFDGRNKKVLPTGLSPQRTKTRRSSFGSRSVRPTIAGCGFRSRDGKWEVHTMPTIEIVNLETKDKRTLQDGGFVSCSTALFSSVRPLVALQMRTRERDEVVLVDLAEARVVLREEHDGPTQFLRRAQYLAGSRGGDARVWNASTGKLMLQGLGKLVVAGGERRVAILRGEQVTILDLDTGERRSQKPAVFTRIWGDRQGLTQVAATNDGRAFLFRARSPVPVALRLPEGKVRTAALSHSGNRVALLIASAPALGAQLLILDAASRATLQQLAVAANADLALSPDGKRVFVHTKGKVTAIEVASGRVHLEREARKRPTKSPRSDVLMSADGSMAFESPLGGLFGFECSYCDERGVSGPLGLLETDTGRWLPSPVQRHSTAALWLVGDGSLLHTERERIRERGPSATPIRKVRALTQKAPPNPQKELPDDTLGYGQADRHSQLRRLWTAGAVARPQGVAHPK